MKITNIANSLSDELRIKKLIKEDEDLLKKVYDIDSKRYLQSRIKTLMEEIGK